MEENKENMNKENMNKDNKNKEIKNTDKKEANKKETNKITAVKNAVVRTVTSVGTEVSAVASSAKNMVTKGGAKTATRPKDAKSRETKKDVKSKDVKTREKTEAAPASEVVEEQDIVETKDGKIAIDIRVIEEFAGHAALDCFGIVGMCNVSMRDGIAKLLTGNSISKGVSVTRDEDGALMIDYHIIVAYGVSIQTVVSNLINTVKYQIEDYTNKKVKAINVYVEGVRVID